MNKIIAKDHFESSNWELNIEEIGAYYNDFFIGFTDKAPIVTFHNLKFGFELKQGENIKKYGVYPPTGVKYIETDQEYIVVERLDTKPDETYQLFLWAENDNIKIEKEFEFTIPRPSQPYKSWIWNGEAWEAPISRPNDEKIYIWDEENLEWESLEDEES